MGTGRYGSKHTSQFSDLRRGILTENYFTGNDKESADFYIQEKLPVYTIDSGGNHGFIDLDIDDYSKAVNIETVISNTTTAHEKLLSYAIARAVNKSYDLRIAIPTNADRKFLQKYGLKYKSEYGEYVVLLKSLKKLSRRMGGKSK